MFIVDFYCHSAKLIIELDDSQHYQEKGLLKDKIRTGAGKCQDDTVINTIMLITVFFCV